MVPMRFSTIFKSRWMALLWAGGIVWFALDVAAPSKPTKNEAASNQTDATGLAVSNKDAQTIAGAFGD